MHSLEAPLRQGVADLSLPLDDLQIARLLDYQALIQKWNKVYNLTALRDPVEMLRHHLLDSLAVIGPLRRQLLAQAETKLDTPNDRAKPKLLDAGSGAGLPGVVIAIACPDVAVDCVDAVAKKAAFIQQVAATLRLANLRGLHARIEHLAGRYSVISARAFSSLSDFVSLSSPALAEHGIWLAMKGKHPADEIAALPANVKVFHVEPLLVPGLDAERCIVWIRKT
jgi:16S rRNA (guanine527-N7)-methyltransferase